MKKSTLAAFALPLIFSAAANAEERPVGDTLTCHISYAVDMNSSPKDVGSRFTFNALSADKGISVEEGYLGDLLNVDLKSMNEGDPVASQWQYATLIPNDEHSTHPVDIAFGPTYLKEMEAGNLYSMRIKLGHAKETRVSTGWFSSREMTTQERVGSTPYDKNYYAEAEISMKPTLGNSVNVELPSLNAGLRHIELECWVK
jgi:hypothetical protein